MSQLAAQQYAPNEPEPEETVASNERGRFLMLAMPSWFVSGCVHFLLLIILALLTVAPPAVSATLQMSAAPTVPEEVIVPLEEERPEMNLTEADQPQSSSGSVVTDYPQAEEPTEAPVISVDDATASAPDLVDFGEETVPREDILTRTGGPIGTGLNSRTGSKDKLLIDGGGTPASEAAVALALEWLANHQLPDGGWNYDHRLGACNARCGNGGSLTDCRTGATAQALLPFLGAGQTHKVGKYKKQVAAGLYFLTQQMKLRTQLGLQCGDLAQGGGNMYSHGMAAIVLCEAYGMTQDKGLMMPAQLSLNHIVYAQDPVGGGWRYAPRTPGDTSVVGWQLMALKSGHLAYLQVPPQTISGANKFLDSVMSDYSYYGYTDPGRGQATTAIGLLCRMYLGWKKDHPGIEKGIQFLSQTGPSKGNMYYNYYATQCLRHYEGEHWDKWNVKMRDQLVNSQEKAGHLRGSWHMNGDHGSDRGGRLYCTSMATMILEVYYRHMPLYGKQAADDEFAVE
jgi:hypothetical protein